MKPNKIQKILSIRSLLVSGAAFGFPLFCATGDVTQREWASKDGKYSLKASFVSYNPTTKKVTLERGDSSSVKVPLLQLSPIDQDYVKEHAPKTSQAKEAGEATRLHGITWQPNIEGALELARSGPADRPVMWFRVLGKLDDGM